LPSATHEPITRDRNFLVAKRSILALPQSSSLLSLKGAIRFIGAWFAQFLEAAFPAGNEAAKLLKASLIRHVDDEPQYPCGTAIGSAHDLGGRLPVAGT
jgi:hypothetical protein